MEQKIPFGIKKRREENTFLRRKERRLLPCERGEPEKAVKYPGGKIMANFADIHSCAQAIEYLRAKIDEFECVFDGFELIPASKRRGPQKYYPPRYNGKTRQFVAGLGGEIAAEEVLLDFLNRVDYYKFSPAQGTFQEDAFIMKASVPGFLDRLFVKVFCSKDKATGEECPVVVFHD